MKYDIGTYSQEGFETAYALIFENGIELRTKSFLWETAESKKEIKKKFQQILNAIEKNELELTDSPV